ncbi:hypothetical protein [Polymorphospora sp. NPDC050346]|uniref:hypothetical protein n=1 Tax=Polymorphospora sp. NPDC050346 TaxID=3155780 RepID=UPI0033F6786C
MTEVDEARQRMSGVMVAMIQSATQLALVIVELRIAALREAARDQAHQDQAVAQRREQQARVLREQARMRHQADAMVWREAMRPQWWRTAGAEDIARVWRAAREWCDVDPRAAAARDVMVDRLAERGVRVDPTAGRQPTPDDIAWLSDALDRAAADRAAAKAAASEPGRSTGAPPRPPAGPAPEADPGMAEPGAVVEGEIVEQRDERAERAAEAAREQAERADRAAAHVRTVWSADRAERVIGCKAWGALVHLLGELEDAGNDVEPLLRAVPEFVDRAHTPAAFAYRSVEDAVGGVVDLGTAQAPAAAAATKATASARPKASTTAKASPEEAVVDEQGGPGPSATQTRTDAAAVAYPVPTAEAVAAAAAGGTSSAQQTSGGAAPAVGRTAGAAPEQGGR